MAFEPEIAAIRLGYGISPLSPPPADPAALLVSVQRAGPDDNAVTMDEVAEDMRLAQDLRRQERDAKGKPKALKKARATRDEAKAEVSAKVRQATVHRFARAVDDPAGFGERLVQFWADHFTVRGGTPYQDFMAAAFVDEAIRPYLGGRFEDMMFAAETHPRMLTYLNQTASFGPNSKLARRRQGRDLGLNENLAREMIELHSLGVGADYTQTDVRELANLLTGLSFNPRRSGDFRPEIAEPGAEMVLGRTYGGDRPASLDDIRAVIADLAAHEDTARHLARKLAVHFVADDPPAALVDRLAAAYRDSGGDLGAMNATLIEAPEIITHFRQKMRQPYDFMIASLRGLGLDGAALISMTARDFGAHVFRPLKDMGQSWGSPRGPDGWPEEAEYWATPQGIATRIDWAMRHPAKLVPDLPDPRAFVDTVLGTTASEPLLWAVPKAESIREGLVIVLASSDFNRR